MLMVKIMVYLAVVSEAAILVAGSLRGGSL